MTGVTVGPLRVVSRKNSRELTRKTNRFKVWSLASKTGQLVGKSMLEAMGAKKKDSVITNGSEHARRCISRSEWRNCPTSRRFHTATCSTTHTSWGEGSRGEAETDTTSSRNWNWILEKYCIRISALLCNTNSLFMSSPIRFVSLLMTWLKLQTVGLVASLNTCSFCTYAIARIITT